MAIAKATDGRITDAPAKAEQAVDNPAFAAKLNGPSHALNKTRETSGRIPAPVAADVGVQSFVVEIDYDYSFWGTSTLTWTAPQDCWNNPFGVVKYEVPDLSAYGWNDRINAFNNYSYCYTKHFEHAWFQGAFVGWQYGNHNLGVLDGQISSIRWT